MWLESPEHRRIILTAAWREIGLSAVHTASAPNALNGLEVTIVTADFGTPSNQREVHAGPCVVGRRRGGDAPRSH